ncbi:MULTISPECIES: AtpZ/AtpI family protein [unclassified Sphingosinithalassobacter]|uniref:AtpZ/AtpI family protein n=1 Tax=unclassified Sphingosinithalassobacter TaxID=2676235 RepID=UPI00165E60F1|nr:AtpZ/AtpI family protein [Sphingosinithalassobacter sp. CS137]
MAENETGQDDPYGAEDARLTSLEERLKHAQHAEAVRTGRATKTSDGGYSQGNRVLAALIGSLAGSALVGWVLDRLLGTTPWLLLVALFLGIAVAFRNIIRMASERPE